MKKEPTLQEWRKIGNKAKDVIKNLNELRTLISGKLPKTQYQQKWKSTAEAFGKLRSHLDDVVCGKFPEMPDRDKTSIFYGLDEKK